MPHPLPLIFIGTGAIGAPLLTALADDGRFDVRLVVTQIDRPAGRTLSPTPSPIKQKALELGLTVFQPEDVNSPESLNRIKEVGADMIVVMAYGQILRQPLLDVPKFGCINIHASLLPKYRGASPIQQALLNRDRMTGISVMRMERRMDAGPVYRQFDLPIAAEDNAITLADRLAMLTAHETPNTLIGIADGYLEPEPQNSAEATYCQKIQKSDGQINWSEDGKTIEAKIRAYAGWPGTFTFWNGKRLSILSARHDEFSGEPGKVFEKDHLVMVGTGKGSLALGEVQLEGKKPQDIHIFARGYPQIIGAVLGK